VKRPFSFGTTASVTLVSVDHLQSASIVGVTRGQSAIRFVASTSIAVAFAPVPERHINFLFGQRSVPPTFLKLWRTSIVASCLGCCKEDQVWVRGQHLKSLFETFFGRPGFGEDSVFLFPLVLPA
jgi:hypothetical protein